MHTLKINSNDAGQRLDKFLNKTLRTLPNSLLYKSIRTKKIKVNRKRTEPGYVLTEGDTVELFLRDEFFEVSAGEEAFRTLTPNIDIIYEDKHILLCNKRPGMIVHPDDDEDTDTCIAHIQAYLYQKGEYRPDEEQSFAPALCNRIDRNTGGIVIAAKTAQALRIMNEKIKDRELTKKYLCAVHGRFEKKSGTLTGYIEKDQSTNMVKVYDKPQKRRSAKTAVTEYRVIDQKNDLSLLEVKLITGRTHQIRAQMAAAGHPLLGDGKYGVNRDDRKSGYKYQALYSYYLSFDFKTPAEDLDYLNGKEFTVDKKHIYFLKEFE